MQYGDLKPERKGDGIGLEPNELETTTVDRIRARMMPTNSHRERTFG